MDDVGSVVEPTSSLAWAGVIPADFQRVIYLVIENISTCLSCKLKEGYEQYLYKNQSRNRHIYLAKSSLFESTEFASVMIDDVGCSRRHRCPSVS